MKNKSILRRFKKDKGVAGLSILLAVVAMVFIIGFLVMIFVIIGANLSSSQYTPTSITLTNAITSGTVNATGTTLSGYATGYRNCQLTVTNFTNATGGVLIAPANYTVTGCFVIGAVNTNVGFNNTLWNFTGTLSYLSDNIATATIGNTSQSLASVPTWFPIIITIAVMVALILLTVIIIVAIRSSGLLAGGQ